MKKLIATMILAGTMLTCNATNITNWFPHLASTYYGCQRVGFESTTKASDVAKCQVVFRKSGYKFLDFIDTDMGSCYLTFNEQNKRLKEIYYIYKAEDPRIQTTLATLVKMFNESFGSATVKQTYKEDFYTWHYNGFQITLNLDDIRDYVTITVVP